MKKRFMSLILSFVLLLGLFPATAKAAVTAQGSSITVRNPYASLMVQGRAQDGLYDVQANKAITDTSKALQVGMTVTYNQTSVTNKNDSRPGYIFPITVSSPGVVQVEASSLTYGLESLIQISLYGDAACTNGLDFGYLSDTNPEIRGTICVANAGVYYLRVSHRNYYGSNPFTAMVNVKVGFYTSNEMNLTANKTYSLGNMKDAYYRITVPNTSNVMLAASYSGTGDFEYELCNASKKKLYSGGIDSNYGGKHTYKLAKGTYYIKVKGKSSGYTYGLKYSLLGDYTASNNKWTTFYPGNSNVETYVKIKPTVDGYVTVSPYGGNYYKKSMQVTLCNSSKKAIADKRTIWYGDSSYGKYVFGVKKNTTYYLRITGVSERAAVKYVQTGVSEKSGTSKKKAVTIKSNKTVKGTITANSATADWYKFKVTKMKKIKFYLTGNSIGSLRLQVYKSNGKKFGGAITVISGNNKKCNLESTGGNGKMAKGTYYIKIYRANSKSSGNYTLKWK